MGKGICLQNDRLRVEIAGVGEQYRQTRFDWTGNVSQVYLDGKYTFMSTEQPASSEKKGGFGLHNDFRLIGDASFDATPVGEKCIKIGVGLLRKPDENPWNFKQIYECEPFDVMVTQEADRATYHIDPVEVRGVAIEYEKTVRIDGNSLFLEHKLINHGKTFSFSENSHNFLLLGGHLVGPSYLLECTHIPPLSGEKQNYVLKGNTIGWDKELDDFYLSMGDMDVDLDSYDYKLSCSANGLSISSHMDFKPSKFVLYGRTDVICPEIFVDATVEKGGTFAWVRRYDFDKK